MVSRNASCSVLAKVALDEGVLTERVLIALLAYDGYKFDEEEDKPIKPMKVAQGNEPKPVKVARKKKSSTIPVNGGYLTAPSLMAAIRVWNKDPKNADKKIKEHSYITDLDKLWKHVSKQAPDFTIILTKS